MWQIYPKQGLGELRFGMTPSAVDRLADVYGVSKGLSSDRIPEDLLASTIRDLGDQLSPKEKEEILALYRSEGPSKASATEVRGETHSLVLTYENGHLAEILVGAKSKKLAFADVSIFEASPLDVVRRISDVTREPPIFLGEEVVFPDSLIFLFQFLRASSSQGGSEAPVDGDIAERSVTLRATPRHGGTDLSLYKPLAL